MPDHWERRTGPPCQAMKSTKPTMLSADQLEELRFLTSSEFNSVAPCERSQAAGIVIMIQLSGPRPHGLVTRRQVRRVVAGWMPAGYSPAEQR